MNKYPLAVFTTLLFLLLLSGCDSNSTPTLKPTPKNFVTISGNIDPHMQHPITVIYRATYAAYNPKCKKNIAWFEGIRGLAGHSDIYPANPDDKGNYKVEIPIDKYLSGKCNWKAAWVMYAFTPKIPSTRKKLNNLLWSDSIHFGIKGNSQELPGYPLKTSATLYCNTSNINECKGSSIQGWYVNSVSRNKSYHFIQNIKNSGKRNDSTSIV